MDEQEQKNNVWKAVRSAMEDGMSYTVASQTFGVPVGSIKNRSSKEKWDTTERSRKRLDDEIFQQALAEAKENGLDLSKPDALTADPEALPRETGVLWMDVVQGVEVEEPETPEDPNRVMSSEETVDRALKIAKDKGLSPAKVAEYLRALGKEHEIGMSNVVVAGRRKLEEIAKENPDRLLREAGSIDKFDKMARRTLRLDKLEEQAQETKVLIEFGNWVNELQKERRDEDSDAKIIDI